MIIGNAMLRFTCLRNSIGCIMAGYLGIYEKDCINLLPNNISKVHIHPILSKHV